MTWSTPGGETDLSETFQLHINMMDETANHPLNPSKNRKNLRHGFMLAKQVNPVNTTPNNRIDRGWPNPNPAAQLASRLSHQTHPAPGTAPGRATPPHSALSRYRWLLLSSY